MVGSSTQHVRNAFDM